MSYQGFRRKKEERRKKKEENSFPVPMA